MTPLPSLQHFFSLGRMAKVMFILLISFLGTTSIMAQEEDDDKVIELIRADVTEYDAAYLDAERVKGNVRFKHGTALMDCDSAWFYRKENRIEAYGNIYIRQQDTLNLWGDYLNYDGDKKHAEVRRNVRMRDKEMSLETELLEYALENKVAYYPAHGKIRNGQDRLRSRVGRYYSRSRTFFFKDSVVLINPEYTMNSDTLEYQTWSKTAYFSGPTYITSEENTIFCRKGWYDTERNKSNFSRGVWIEGKENKLVADSMVYDRNTGLGGAFREIVLIDTSEDIRITGQYGFYNRKLKLTRITGDPMAVKYVDEDSLFLKADTLIDLTDTSSGNRKLFAYHTAKMHKSDMQGASDSLIYDFDDSTIQMFIDPVIWAEGDQITGDTLIIYRRNGQLDKMDVIDNAFIVSEEVPGHYNQIGGRDMLAKFGDGKLRRIRVFGNGRSLYYARETDSSYTGVNHIECSEMLISIDSNRVDEISFYTNPEGKFYPVDQLPSNLRTLKGFRWLTDRRPQLTDFLKQREEREEERSDHTKDLLKSDESIELPEVMQLPEN